MSFRLRHGLNLLVTAGVAVACNTYNSDLLLDNDSVLDSSDTGDSTLTGGSGGSDSNSTTSLTTTASTNTSTNGGGDGGTGGTGGNGGSGGSSDVGGATGSANQTTTAGGSGGSVGNTNSTSTETTTTTTTTTDGGSGGTGGGGTGGSGGTGGIPIDVLLIDDLEDGNNQLERPTYSGYWFTTVDETGSGALVPDPADKCEPEELDPPRDDSTEAMHVSGNWSGDVWIAAVGFALQDDEAPVDASSYTGVSFYAKTDDENTRVRLLVMITDVEDEAHYEIEITLTTSWELHTVTWDDPRLLQPSWTVNEVPFNPANLWKLQFQFDTEDFDFWVDDIRFTE